MTPPSRYQIVYNGYVYKIQYRFLWFWCDYKEFLYGNTDYCPTYNKLKDAKEEIKKIEESELRYRSKFYPIDK